MGENEQGFWQGGAAGAGTGAAIGATVGAAAGGIGAVPGAAIGAAGGFIIGGVMGNMSANNARMAKKRAAQEAEKARRESLVREFGAKQQAEAAAFSSNMNRGGRSGGGSTAPGVVGAPDSQGTIGANIAPKPSNYSSGTF